MLLLLFFWWFFRYFFLVVFVLCCLFFWILICGYLLFRKCHCISVVFLGIRCDFLIIASLSLIELTDVVGVLKGPDGFVGIVGSVLFACLDIYSDVLLC